MVCERSGALQTDCLALERFLQRLSLVHTQVKIHYKLQVNGAPSLRIYGDKQGCRFSLKGRSLLTDSAHYLTYDGSVLVEQCGRVHPVSGRAVSLSLPQGVVESGLGGELTMLPVAALCPCLRQHPNKPASITSLHISFQQHSTAELALQGRE
ncbi:type 2 DNA topoisomerase 6 subunit B-like [Acipenser ruthenus]|nr:type 2 DNA topoisomerase 6 subunit B-like [Acipenser ruthenus]